MYWDRWSKRFVTSEEARKARAIPPGIRTRTSRFLGAAPYFTEHVRQLVQKKYGRDALYRNGLKIYTTVDLTMRRAAEEAIQHGLRAPDKRQGYRGPDKNLDPDEVPQHKCPG